MDEIVGVEEEGTADKRPELRIGRAHPHMAKPYVSMHSGGHDADERRFIKILEKPI